MKNKSLVTIILVSIVTFAALVFSLYKFVLKEKTVFYSDGYVSITDSDVPEKAYFIKGTEYKKDMSAGNTGRTIKERKEQELCLNQYLQLQQQIMPSA
mgnify:CR=1 FL=1